MLNQEENKNDRGHLEQPEQVSSGNQALTLSHNVSPNQNFSASSNEPLYTQAAYNRTQLPHTRIEEAQRAATRGRVVPRGMLIPQPSLNPDELGMCIDVLERQRQDEEAIDNRSDLGKSKVRDFGTQAAFEPDSDGHSHDTRNQTSDDQDADSRHDEFSLVSHIDTHGDEDDDYYQDVKLGSSSLPQTLSTLPSDHRRDVQPMLHDDDYVMQKSTITSSTANSRVENPKKGFLFYVCHTIIMSANLYSQQLLFKAAPQMAIMQLTFIRGAVCTLIMFLYINRNLKSTLIDPINRRNVLPIAFRCFQGGVSVYIGFVSLNYFTVSTVGVVVSMKPVIACIIGILCLGERMLCKDIVSMGAILGAVVLIIFGQTGSQDDAKQANVGAFIMLIAQPILLAVGDTMLRALKKMPEELCSSYQNMMLTCLGATFMMIDGLSFSFVFELSGAAWTYIVLSCSLTIMGSITKAKAFQNCESSKLQKLSFLPNVWQFFIDLIVLSVVFSSMQLAGFSLLIGFYTLDASSSVIIEKLRNRKQFVANDDGYSTV